MQELVRTIKYESDRVKGFGDEIMQVPGCENLQSCIQCGTCSGMCPLSIYMDFTPRQIIELVRSDFKNEVLKSYTYGCAPPAMSALWNARVKCI
jgi:heterodisulfide reductase subunit C